MAKELKKAATAVASDIGAQDIPDAEEPVPTLIKTDDDLEDLRNWDVRRRKLRMGLQPVRGELAMQWVSDAVEDYLADHARDVTKEGCKDLLKLFRHEDETDPAKHKVSERSFEASSLDAIETLTQTLFQKLHRVGYEQQGLDINQAARELILLQHLHNKSPRALCHGFSGHGLRNVRGRKAFLAHVVQKMDGSALISVCHSIGHT